jgi:hypothetical protein
MSNVIRSSLKKNPASWGLNIAIAFLGICILAGCVLHAAFSKPKGPILIHLDNPPAPEWMKIGRPTFNITDPYD